MSNQNSGTRRGQPITDAIYGHKSRRAPKPGPEREVPQRGFTIASKLSAETLKKLGWTGAPLKPRRKRRPKAAK